MATVVLVHGIAQELQSADSLERAWLPDLAGGIREAGFGQIADRIAPGHAGDDRIDVRMAFYGGLFRPEGEDIQGSGAGEVTEDDELAEALARDWIANIAARSADQEERRLAHRDLALAAGPLEEEMGTGALKRRAVKFLGERKYFAALGFAMATKLGNSALSQVSGYLADEEIRAEALRRVEELLDADTRVLVGHSLGSVIVYEAAHRLDQPLPLLVTLGSPLGLGNIVYERVRPQPPAFPPRAARWVNVADREDAVAAEPDLREQFPPPPGGTPLEGVLIDNGAKPHSATPYLTAQQVGRPIAEALAGL